MAITTAYLVAAGRLEEFFDTIRRAQAPETFTLTFLKDLGFTSSNERLYIPVLKGLGFLDEGGTPTDRYYAFLDDSRWQIVLAEGIRDAYEDLFRLDRHAEQLSRDEIVGKLRTLTRGQYSESVIGNMAKSFEALCALANFEEPSIPLAEVPSEVDPPEPPRVAEEKQFDATHRRDSLDSHVKSSLRQENNATLTYRIEIVLPSTRDKSVYDSIFRSLKEHIL
jgi:hypothetical protein